MRPAETINSQPITLINEDLILNYMTVTYIINDLLKTKTIQDIFSDHGDINKLKNSLALFNYASFNSKVWFSHREHIPIYDSLEILTRDVFNKILGIPKDANENQIYNKGQDIFFNLRYH